MKYYTVSEVGFSYNDEIYSSNDEGDGKPLRLFKSKEAAELAKLVLSRKKFADADDLRNYFYSVEDIFNRRSDKLNSLFEKYKFDKSSFGDDDYDRAGAKLSEFSQSLSDEDFQTFLDCLYLKFYSVEEVELVSSKNELLTSPEEWEREVGRKMKGE